MNSKQTDQRAAEGEPKMLTEGELAAMRDEDRDYGVISGAHKGYDLLADRRKLLDHAAALEAEIAEKERIIKSISDKPYCDLTTRTVNDKTFAQYVADWFAGNQRSGEEGQYYHGVFPLGMVGTWIRRAERAEQENAAIQQRLAEANNPEAVEELGPKVILHKSHYDAILGRATRAEQEISNYQTYGQGGATFNESQWIERLAQAEQTRDAKIEELEKRLATLAEPKDGEALESLAQMAMDEYNKRILTGDCLESWGAAINVVIAHVRAQCEARHAAELAAANERVAASEAELRLWKPLTTEEAEAELEKAEGVPISDEEINRIVAKIVDPAYRPSEPEYVKMAAKIKQLQWDLDEANEAIGEWKKWQHVSLPKIFAERAGVYQTEIDRLAAELSAAKKLLAVCEAAAGAMHGAIERIVATRDAVYITDDSLSAAIDAAKMHQGR